MAADDRRLEAQGPGTTPVMSLLRPRASGCRLSFYVYNTLDEVDTAVAAVAAVATGRRTSGAPGHLATHIRSSDHADLSIVP
jgi:hypothetical protein